MESGSLTARAAAPLRAGEPGCARPNNAGQKRLSGVSSGAGLPGLLKNCEPLPQAARQTEGRMSEKVRIYQLARDLGLETKAMLEVLDEMGVENKSHSRTLDAETAETTKHPVTDGATDPPKPEP